MAVTWRAWRLTFGLQRTELLALMGGALLLTIGSVVVAWQTTETRAAFLACMQSAGSGSDACRGYPLNDLAQWGTMGKLIAQWSPLILGLFLGVPVVAREIEERTALIAWSLDPSRSRWLMQRALPVIVALLVASVLIGVGGELLSQAAPFGETPLGPGFTDYGSRLGQVPVRAVAVFVVGVGIGTLVPRQLPAVLLAGGTVIALFMVLTLGMGAWMQASAEPIPYDRGLESGSRLFDQAFQNKATGALIRTGSFDASPPPENPPPPAENAPPGMTRVWIGIPGDEYGVWVIRESSVVLGGAFLVAAGTFILVQRRRPT